MKAEYKYHVLRGTTNRREYSRLIRFVEPWDDRDRFVINRPSKGTVGYWKKKRIFPAQRRACRTWKHNRLTKWKSQFFGLRP